MLGEAAQALRPIVLVARLYLPIVVARTIVGILSFNRKNSAKNKSSRPQPLTVKRHLSRGSIELVVH